MRLAIAWLWLLAGPAIPPVSPSDRPTITLDATDDVERLTAQVRLELRALALTSEAATRPTEACQAAPDRIRVVLRPASVQVCKRLADGSTLSRTADLDPVTSDNDARVAALRVVELVRAIEDATAAAIPKPPPLPGVDDEVPDKLKPKPPDDDPTPARGPVELDILPQVAWSPGGVGPSMQVELGVAYWATDRVGFGFSSLLPAVRGLSDTPEGRSQFWWGDAVLGVRVRLTPPRWQGFFDTALGVGFAFAHIVPVSGGVDPEGNPIDLQGRGTLFGGTGRVSLAGGYRFGERVGVLATVSTEVIYPPFGITVRREGDSGEADVVARFGSPVIAAGAGVRLRL